MSAPNADEQHRLQVERARLAAEHDALLADSAKVGRARRGVVRQAIRDVAVQALATVLGGSVLAGLAQLAGLLPSDGLSITVVAIGVVSFLAAVGVWLRDASQGPLPRRILEIRAGYLGLRCGAHVPQRAWYRWFRRDILTKGRVRRVPARHRACGTSGARVVTLRREQSAHRGLRDAHVPGDRAEALAGVAQLAGRGGPLGRDEPWPAYLLP